LMALYSVRSERQLCEQLGYNLLFRWFLDLDMTSATFDASAFSHNRDRLLEHQAAAMFFHAVYDQARAAGLVSNEHFSVDGTLIEAWASLKSFRPKDENDDDSDGNGWSDFKGQKRSNETHESKTDPESRLARKGNGKEAKLSYSGNVLMENRNGLVTDVRIEPATGQAERDAAIAMVEESIPGDGRVTVGADKAYDRTDLVREMRQNNVTLHAAQKAKYSAIDARTTRHTGYAVSQTVRRRVEPVFGWLKTVANLRRTRYRGKARLQLSAYIATTAYNLLRMSRLMPSPA
jgi:IS5 family transposase